MVGDIHLVFPHGRNITEYVDHNFPWGVWVKGMTIPISDLDRLEIWVVDATMLRIMGS